MFRSLTIAAALLALAGTAQAAPAGNGMRMNGISFNGLSANGFSLNGLTANGFTANGLSYNGPVLQGARFNGIQLQGIRHNGQALGEGLPGLVLRGVTLGGGAGMMMTAD